MPKSTGKYMRHDDEEMYRYNMVIPLRIFRMVQEVCLAENRTIVKQLIIWVKEGYERWQEEQRRAEAKKINDARLVNVFGGVSPTDAPMPDL